MKIIKAIILFTAMTFMAIIFLNACRPIRNFTSSPKVWTGGSDIRSKIPEYDSTKKTVFIVADYKLTELFDMLAPFYLFNVTEKANVYIVAKENTPILIKRDLFLCPQLTFQEADSMHLKADVIVIPALSIRDEHQDTVLINWIKNHFDSNSKMLSICDGSSTAAATGYYDGKPLTTHASDYDNVKAHFDKPVWVQNVSVTKSDNLFSTAGVSNAVEGSLTVVQELFGNEILHHVFDDIHYPYPEIKVKHESIALSGRNKFTFVKKILFRNNRDIGVLLQNGMNEFEMAGILDIYGRTFPSSFKTFILNDTVVKTKYGLSLIYTGDNTVKHLDELHVLIPESFFKADAAFFKKAKMINYDEQQKGYLFNTCLERIAGQYGRQFGNVIKISLDYN